MEGESLSNFYSVVLLVYSENKDRKKVTLGLFSYQGGCKFLNLRGTQYKSHF